MKNRIFDQILDFIVLLDGEFKYEFNGFFRSKNEEVTVKTSSAKSDRESDTWSLSRLGYQA